MSKRLAAILATALLISSPRARAEDGREAAIQKILDEEVAAWNKGDARAYSQRFAVDGTFTNIRGMFFKGYQPYLDRHDEIFKGMFRGTTLQQKIVSVRFVARSVAVVETLTWISGFPAGLPPNLHADAKGRLRTRLLQVMVKQGPEWKIAVYHNVDLKPDVTAPEPGE